MRALRAAMCAALALTGSTWIVPLHGACAAAPGHVALVIDLGDEGGDLEYCVAISEREVTGIDVIELAGDQFGLEYGLGYGGGAVCMLAGVGPEGDDCFASHPDFWGYWRGDGKGDWSWSSSGAGTSSVSSGDTQGWSWGSGMDGGTHPKPPPKSFADVCGAAAPVERDEPERTSGDPSEPPPVSRPPASEPPSDVKGQDDAQVSDAHVPRGRGRGERGNSREPIEEASPAPTADGDAPVVTAVRRRNDDAPSTPVGPLAALGATAVLGAGAIVINRRRARGALARGGR